MAIMPTADSTHTPPPISALGRIDGCPECVHNTEAPIDADPAADGYVATYRCAACGHRWSTAWRD
jgi:DNA-directed RNA polymerase subunit M/transcription elongation factor TFIIS